MRPSGLLNNEGIIPGHEETFLDRLMKHSGCSPHAQVGHDLNVRRLMDTKSFRNSGLDDSSHIINAYHGGEFSLLHGPGPDQHLRPLWESQVQVNKEHTSFNENIRLISRRDRNCSKSKGKGRRYTCGTDARSRFRIT